jgi:hypothetical protein
MYPYTFEVRNAFEKMSQDETFIQLVKNNEFFVLTTSSWHANANFWLDVADESTCDRSSKAELLAMCPSELLSFFSN